jgi:hypothetical protein
MNGLLFDLEGGHQGTINDKHTGSVQKHRGRNASQSKARALQPMMTPGRASKATNAARAHASFALACQLSSSILPRGYPSLLSVRTSNPNQKM